MFTCVKKNLTDTVQYPPMLYIFDQHSVFCKWPIFINREKFHCRALVNVGGFLFESAIFFFYKLLLEMSTQYAIKTFLAVMYKMPTLFVGHNRKMPTEVLTFWTSKHHHLTKCLIDSSKGFLRYVLDISGTHAHVLRRIVCKTDQKNITIVCYGIQKHELCSGTGKHLNESDKCTMEKHEAQPPHQRELIKRNCLNQRKTSTFHCRTHSVTKTKTYTTPSTY